jgi:hypothetical protein
MAEYTGSNTIAVLLICVFPKHICTGTLSVLKISGRTEQQCKRKKEMKQNRTCLQSINQEGNGRLQFEIFLCPSEVVEIQFIILIGYFFYTDIHNKIQCWRNLPTEPYVSKEQCYFYFIAGITTEST